MKRQIGAQIQLNNSRQQPHSQIKIATVRRKNSCFCESPILLFSAFLLLFCLMSKTPLSDGMPAHWKPKNYTVTLVQIIDSKTKAKRSIQEVIETEEDRKPLVMVNGNNKILIVGQYPNIISGERIDPQKYGSVNILRLVNTNSTTESIIRSGSIFTHNGDDDPLFDKSSRSAKIVVIRGMLSNNFVCMTRHGTIYGGMMTTSLAIRQLSDDCLWRLQMEHGELFFYQEEKSRSRAAVRRRYLGIEETQVLSSSRRSANTNFRFFFRYDRSSNVQQQERQLNHVLSDRVNIAGEQYNLIAKHSALREWHQRHTNLHCAAERHALLLEVQADDELMTKVIQKIQLAKTRFQRALVDCQCYRSDYIHHISQTFHRYLLLQKNSIPHLNAVMKIRRQQNRVRHCKEGDQKCRHKRKRHRQVEQKALLKLHGSNLLANAELYQRGLRRQNACYRRINPAWQWFKRNPEMRSPAPQVKRLRNMRQELIKALFPIYVAKNSNSTFLANSSSVSLSYIVQQTLNIALPKPTQLHKALLRRSLIRKFQLRHDDFLIWDKFVYHMKFEQLRVKLNHTRTATDPRPSDLKLQQCFEKRTKEKMQDICFTTSMFVTV